MSRKKKLQKKIAVAVSVVNILNVGAPMVLPYVNMTRDLSARGGYMEPVQGGARLAAAGVLADAVQAVMPEKTAEAYTDPVTSGQTVTNETIEGGNQHVSSGGTANGTTVNSGGHQWVNSSGTANDTTINSGGRMCCYAFPALWKTVS